MAGLGPGGRVKRKAKAKRSTSRRQAAAAERLLGAQLTEREGKLLSEIQASPRGTPAANKRLLARAKAVRARAKARARTGAQLTEKEGAARARRRAKGSTFK